MVCNEFAIFNINFWASIVTILSIFLALYIFLYDRYTQEKKEKQKYINSLNSLNFELQKNNKIILKFFKRDAAQFLNVEKIAEYRYSTNITNNLLSIGTIQDLTLLRNLDAIADKENQINRILDSISLISSLSRTISIEENVLFKNRIKIAQNTILGLNEKLEKYFPKVINDLKNHMEEIDNKKIYWFCKKISYIQELPPEIFE
jgi:hypothetical protein